MSLHMPYTIRHVVGRSGCLSTCGSVFPILVPWGTAPCLQLLQIAQPLVHARVRVRSVKAEVKPRPSPPSEDLLAARRITAGSRRLSRKSSTNSRVSDVQMRGFGPEKFYSIRGHCLVHTAMALATSRQAYHQSYCVSSTCLCNGYRQSRTSAYPCGVSRHDLQRTEPKEPRPLSRV